MQPDIIFCNGKCFPSIRKALVFLRLLPFILAEEEAASKS